MDVTSFILGSLIFAVVSATIVYLLGVEPGRIVGKWLVALANGESLPQRPKIGCRFWLYSIHRECLAVEKRINDMHTGYDSVQARARPGGILAKPCSRPHQCARHFS